MKSKIVFILVTILLLICTCTDQKAKRYFNKGYDYFDDGLFDKAIECYQKAVEINPDYANAYYNMGIAYAYKENYDKALECCQKAIEIKNDYANAYYNMGFSYLAKDLDISAADSFYQAGLLFLKQKNRQLVLRTIESMKEYTPDSPLIQKLMDKLYEE